MSERTLLVFEDLLPKPREGDIAPCRAVLETTGSRAGEAMRVVMMDRGVALQAARTGGWAEEELERALAFEPDELLIDDRADAAELVGRLRGLARSDSLDELRVEDYGELTSALLMNGLLLSEHVGVLRPGAANPALLDAAELEAAFEKHVSATQALAAERARSISIVGTGWLSDRARRGAVARAILERGFRIASLTVGAGPAGALLEALRFVVELCVRTAAPPPQLRVGSDSAAEVSLIASEIAGPLDLATLERVDAAWRQQQIDEALLRRSDDALRRTCFAAISSSRERRAGDQESNAVATAVSHLGPAQSWIRSYRQASRNARPRIVLIPTWQCELRCRYCRIPKQDGRVMPLETVDRSLDLLLSSDSEELDLHFFGGEPLAAWDVIQHTLSTGHARAKAEGRSMRFLFTTNGWALSRERFDWLAQFSVWYQLSLDGDSATQNAARPALRLAGDSYERSPADKAAWFREAGIEHDVVQVVHPSNVQQMAANFRHILDLGYERIQLNYALGTLWERPAIEEFGRQLALIGEELEGRWRQDKRAECVNLEETLLAVRGNLEVTVDWDGGVFGSTAFLVNTKHREDFRLGHLDDARSWDRYQFDGFAMEEVVSNWFSQDMADNNRMVGSVLMSFIRYMRKKHPVLELRASKPSDKLTSSREEAP